MPGNDLQDDAQLRWALKQAALRNRKWKRLEGGTGEDGLILPQAMPSPEHYHIVYNVPSENISVPHFADVYVEAKEAYEKIFVLGKEAEPRAEFYDEGLVGIETRLHGRTDLWWVVLEVAACIKASCMRTVEREKQKRRLILLPGDV